MPTPNTDFPIQFPATDVDQKRDWFFEYIWQIQQGIIPLPPSAIPTLQQVTDSGNTTTTDVELRGTNILNARVAEYTRIGDQTIDATTNSPSLYLQARSKSVRSTTDTFFSTYIQAADIGAASRWTLAFGTSIGAQADMLTVTGAGNVVTTGGLTLGGDLNGPASQVDVSFALDVGTVLTVNQAAFFPDGSAASPSMAFTSDINSGWYWSAADYFFLVVAGVDLIEYWGGAGFQRYAACYDMLGSYSALFMQEVAASPADPGDWVDFAVMWGKDDQTLHYVDGNEVDHIITFGPFVTKSFTFTSQGIGAGTYYIAGDYHGPATDANLTQASPTQTHGDANIAYGAHMFLVAGGAGSASGGAGAVEIEVSGTSVTDLGDRTAGDTEVIVADITAMSLNEYFETTKKWIGQITYTLQNAGGSTQTTFNADFNYGHCKYDDFCNTDFTVSAFEAVGIAGANDTNFNVTLFHHNDTGWTYSAAAFEPGGSGIIYDMITEYVTETDLDNGDHFAMKNTVLDTFVNGDDSEGVVIRIVTGANNSVQNMNAHVSVTY